MKKKFLYSLPMLGAVTLSITSVVACGDSKTKKILDFEVKQSSGSWSGKISLELDGITILNLYFKYGKHGIFEENKNIGNWKFDTEKTLEVKKLEEEKKKLEWEKRNTERYMSRSDRLDPRTEKYQKVNKIRIKIMNIKKRIQSLGIWKIRLNLLIKKMKNKRQLNKLKQVIIQEIKKINI